MRDTEYYLAQANFCAELAESIKRPDYKDRWLKTAQEWRDLAKQVEQGGEACARPALVGAVYAPLTESMLGNALHGTQHVPRKMFHCDASDCVAPMIGVRRRKNVVVGTYIVVMTDSGQCAGNGLRFATKEEAEAYVAALSSVRKSRVVESSDPVTYRWENGRLARHESQQPER